jgi:hypothetical protein
VLLLNEDTEAVCDYTANVGVNRTGREIEANDAETTFLDRDGKV